MLNIQIVVLYAELKKKEINKQNAVKVSEQVRKI